MTMAAPNAVKKIAAMRRDVIRSAVIGFAIAGSAAPDRAAEGQRSPIAVAPSTPDRHLGRLPTLA